MKRIACFAFFLFLFGCAKNVDVKTNEEATNAAATKPAPTAQEQMEAMGKMCSDTAEARKARNEKSSLYKRLGGASKIRKVVTDWVELHYRNEKVAPFFRNSDSKKASKRGADWLITVAGGPKLYKGPGLKVSHGHRNIDTEAFLAAGADVMQAMKDNGYTEEQTQDLMCLLGSHQAEVVASAH